MSLLQTLLFSGYRADIIDLEAVDTSKLEILMRRNQYFSDLKYKMIKVPLPGQKIMNQVDDLGLPG